LPSPNLQKDLLPKTIVRSDVNLERWNIFGTQRTKGYRVMKRQWKDQNGALVSQEVTVGVPGSTDTLTAQEAKVFYLLLNLWAKNESPDGVIHGSFREVFMALRGATQKKSARPITYGNWDKKWFEKKLDNLLHTIIEYKSAYETPEGTYLVKETFTLLNRLEMFDRKTNRDHLYYDISHFTIHPVIVKSILGKNIKPLRLDVLVKLRSEISIILYRYLDLMLNDKVQYERNIDSLAKDLNFGSTYIKNLLKQLRVACAELEGKDLSTGRIEFCQVQKTADKKNWKIIARKGKQILVLASAEPATPENSVIDEDARDLLAYHQSLSPEEQAKVSATAEEIARVKYQYGGNLTKRFSLLDALRDHRQTAATPMFESLAIEPN
jgi:hypothetical protein